MEVSNGIALACLAIAIPQGLSACWQLYDRRQTRQRELREGIVISNESNPPLIALLLLLGTIATVWFGAWMYFEKPLRPVVQTVTVEKVVEKPIPCPIALQKNGPATARGGHDAIAHSGNGDTFTQTPPPAPPTKVPH
jgi:hypothetical protein